MKWPIKSLPQHSRNHIGGFSSLLFEAVNSALPGWAKRRRVKQRRLSGLKPVLQHPILVKVVATRLVVIVVMAKNFLAEDAAQGRQTLFQSSLVVDCQSPRTAILARFSEKAAGTMQAIRSLGTVQDGVESMSLQIKDVLSEFDWQITRKKFTCD